MKGGRRHFAVYHPVKGISAYGVALNAGEAMSMARADDPCWCEVHPGSLEWFEPSAQKFSYVAVTSGPIVVEPDRFPAAAMRTSAHEGR